MAEAVVEARGLGRRYGARSVLENIDLDVHAAQAFAVVGPDGAGKSTPVSSTRLALPTLFRV